MAFRGINSASVPEDPRPVTVATPAYSAGDLLVFCIGDDGGAGTTWPFGWTQRYDLSVSTPDGQGLAVATKVAVAAESESYTVQGGGSPYGSTAALASFSGRSGTITSSSYLLNSSSNTSVVGISGSSINIATGGPPVVIVIEG